jgi:hypothetical protein
MLALSTVILVGCIDVRPVGDDNDDNDDNDDDDNTI